MSLLINFFFCLNIFISSAFLIAVSAVAVNVLFCLTIQLFIYFTFYSFYIFPTFITLCLSNCFFFSPPKNSHIFRAFYVCFALLSPAFPLTSCCDLTLLYPTSCFFLNPFATKPQNIVKISELKDKPLLPRFLLERKLPQRNSRQDS